VEVISFSFAAILTSIFELVVFLIFYGRKIDFKYLIFNVVIINFITNLSLNTILTYMSNLSDFVYMEHGYRIKLFNIGLVKMTTIVSELIVLITECLMYKYAFKKYIEEKIILKRNLYLVVLLANLVTLSIGMIIFMD